MWLFILFGFMICISYLFLFQLALGWLLPSPKDPETSKLANKRRPMEEEKQKEFVGFFIPGRAFRKSVRRREGGFIITTIFFKFHAPLITLFSDLKLRKNGHQRRRRKNVWKLSSSLTHYLCADDTDGKKRKATIKNWLFSRCLFSPRRRFLIR